MNDISTKEKILVSARELFGEKGLNGVSIRDISSHCGVNVAGVNYHFSGKENLYIETVKRSIQKTNNDIFEIFQKLKVKKTETLVVNTFKMMLENEEDLRSCLRLMMGSDGSFEELADELEKYKGPPGGEYFELCLKAEFPKARELDIKFAVRVLFSHMMHTAMIMCNPLIRESLSRSKVDQKVIENDIKRLIRLVQTDLAS